MMDTIRFEEGVSIIIPNWNHHAYLCRALLSALKTVSVLQKNNIAAEIIVFDDCSRDSSQEYLKIFQMLYPNPNLTIYYRDENAGLPAMRNLGMRMSRYRYNISLDADNGLLSENIPLFYQAIRETHAAVVYGNLIVFTQGKPTKLVSNKVAQSDLYRENYIDAMNLFDKAQILQAGGFNEEKTRLAWEDWECLLHLLSQERDLVFVPAVFGRYYINAYSMVQEFGKMQDEHASLYKHIKRVFNQNGSKNNSQLSRVIGKQYYPGLGVLSA